MPRTPPTLPTSWTMADLLEHFGGIAPRRIRLHPPPGKATEKDVIRIHDRENRLCELVDGVLVEKIMGLPEAYLAVLVAQMIANFADTTDLGMVVGADGMVRLMPKLVRIPDVSFTSWDRLPRRMVPSEPLPDLVPDLAVEVLSKGNTRGEMRRKLKDYFLSGVRLVWFVNPFKRTVTVYTAPDVARVLDEAATLDGGDVLPGLAIPVQKIFARLEPVPRPKRRGQANGSRRSSRKAR